VHIVIFLDLPLVSQGGRREVLLWVISEIMFFRGAFLLEIPPVENNSLSLLWSHWISSEIILFFGP